MDYLFSRLGVKKKPAPFAIFALTFALILEAGEFAFGIKEIGFTLEEFFVFFFDTVVIFFVIFSIWKKKMKLLEVSIVVLKTFEGTYYPLIACRRIDFMAKTQMNDAFYLTNYILFGLASFMMFVALITFCIDKFTDTFTSWNWMKLFIILASAFMFVSTIFFAVEIIRGTIDWHDIFEPLSLHFMFFGVYATCEFIEGNPVHE